MAHWFAKRPAIFLPVLTAWFLAPSATAAFAQSATYSFAGVMTGGSFPSGTPVKGTFTINFGASHGVGGAPGGDRDEACAQAGVAKIADRVNASGHIPI